MRSTTSAALALTLAIVVSPLTALACAWDCSRTPEAPAAMVSAAAESCHRTEVDDALTTAALRAVPHECASHDAPGGSFVATTAARQPMPGTALISVALPASSLVERTSVSIRLWAVHDLAPPGATPGLIVPLRI